MNKSKNTLYGDGVHDDTSALQEMIDSGACEISLPAPENFYLISRTLTLPSNFRLILPRFAKIKLADGANCPMLSNKLVEDFAQRLPEETSALCRHFWYFVNDYSPEIMSENIEVRGGVWDLNNQNQIPNPEQTKIFEPHGYTGDGMFFYGVKNLTLADMTIKDPTHYGVTLDRVSYFTVENICFDYNYGNPNPVNMDGIHINGNSHYGYIRNLKGACYDDLVALNAHEGSQGPITNIEIDGIFSEDCHSAVRLLTVHDEVRNIHISNVFGTYFQYCIGISKYYPGETTGRYDAITLDNIYASKAERYPIYAKGNSYVFPPISIHSGVVVDHLTLRNFHRHEYTTPVESIVIRPTSVVKSFIIDNVTSENHTGKPMPLLVNQGEIGHLVMTNVSADGDEILVNEGDISSRSGEIFSK